jgi:hypothetical protein
MIAMRVSVDRWSLLSAIEVVRPQTARHRGGGVLALIDSLQLKTSGR